VLVHVLTQKGKGYAPAETDPEKKLHDTSAFDIATGRANGGKRGRGRWTQAFSEALLDLAEDRRRDLSRSPRRCRARPGCCRSPNATPTRCSTSASPSSTR
jgi:hypothetical protein